MDKNILESFLNQSVELVKDNDFVEYGKIIAVHNNCISFYISKQGKTIIIDFNRIVEIRPQKHNYTRKYNEYYGGNNDR